MHIVLINQFYPPAQAPTGLLLRDLAEELLHAGHTVTVVTSASQYGGAANEEQASLSGVSVIRMGPDRAHGSSLFSKLRDYAGFVPRVSAVLGSLMPLPNVVICMTTPPFIGLVAQRWTRREGVPVFLWCMDLYPEALCANGLFGSRNPLYRFLGGLARQEREEARAVISLGGDMSRRIADSAPSATILELPVWSRLAPIPEEEARARELRRARGWSDEEVILLYIGNIGRAHRVDEFAALAIALQEAAVPVRMVFSGNGPLQSSWKQRLGGRVSWCDPVSSVDVAAHLLAADVHLISQAPEWTGVVVPSKYQAACALGRPVLFAGDPKSAVAQWIERDDCGWVVSPDDPEFRLNALVHELCDAAVRKQKGFHARRQSDQLFHAATLKQRLRTEIENAMTLMP